MIQPRGMPKSCDMSKFLSDYNSLFLRNVRFGVFRFWPPGIVPAEGIRNGINAAPAQGVASQDPTDA